MSCVSSAEQELPRTMRNISASRFLLVLATIVAATGASGRITANAGRVTSKEDEFARRLGEEAGTGGLSFPGVLFENIEETLSIRPRHFKTPFRELTPHFPSTPYIAIRKHV